MPKPKTCPICGKPFDPKSQHTVYCSPECRKQATENQWAERMRKRSEDTAALIGERNGKCVVIGPADPDPTYNRTRIMLRCDCGNEFPANLSEWRNRHSPTMCKKCRGMRTANPYLDRTGEQIGNLTILGMEGEWRGEYKTVYRVRCGLCGGESTMDGAHLKTNRVCARCNRKNLDTGRKLFRSGDVDGTNVYVIQSSLDGRRKTNRNSTTGITGVNKLGEDKYRAVIVFRRKQYHLGTFATIDEAAAARKEAEEHLYGDFLTWYHETVENHGPDKQEAGTTGKRANSRAADLTGKRFGELEVLRRDENRTGHDAFWVCRCGRCGSEKSIRTAYLTGKRAYQDCGCSWNERKADLTGQTLGGVQVLKLLPERKREQKNYRVRCLICGMEREMVQHDLLLHPESCGCVERERNAERLRKQAADAAKSDIYEGARIGAAHATEPLPTNTTGYRWVRWYPRNNCWCATFTIQGQRYFKYGFSTAESAFQWAKEEHERIVQEIGIPSPDAQTEK